MIVILNKFNFTTLYLQHYRHTLKCIDVRSSGKYYLNCALIT